MDKSALKACYINNRHNLHNKTLDSKGAGLGFIAMARQSIYPIEFNFQEIDSEYLFFTICLWSPGPIRIRQMVTKLRLTFSSS